MRAPAAPALRRPRLRPRRPPPGAAPGPARGGLRPGQDARAVRRHRRRAAERREPGRSCSPGPATSRPRPRWPPTPAGTAAGTTVVWRPLPATRPQQVVIVTAGTADPPWPTSAPRCSPPTGSRRGGITDVGVAGLHRLLPHVDELAAADAVVVVAGMEGALASVVGGLTRRAGRRRADQRRLRRRPRGRHRAARRCWPRAPPASPSSASTTATARPAPSPACSVRRAGVTTVAWFHRFSGIAGDMALGALLDAGADLDEVRDPAPTAAGRGLAPRGGGRPAGRCRRHRALVTAPEAGQPDRHLSDIADHRCACNLAGDGWRPGRWRRSSGWPRSRAASTGEPPDAGALPRGRRPRRHRRRRRHLRGARGARRRRRSAAAPVAVGTGTVRAAHGVLPNPAPAVVALLAGAPTYGVDIPVELTTPTGAALLAALADAWGPMPAMTVRAVGYGAGTATWPTGRTSPRSWSASWRRHGWRAGPARRAARGQRRRRHRRGPRPRRRPAARRRRPRRVGHADRDEEGPAGPHRARPVPTRRCADELGRRAAAPRPARSACAAITSSAGPRPAPRRSSWWTASRCG